MSDKPLPLRPGEYVTLIFLPAEGHTHLSLSTVITSSLTRFSVPYGAVSPNKSSPNDFALEEEGVRWLRGQFIIGSPEVDAAVVAQGLELKEKHG